MSVDDAIQLQLRMAHLVEHSAPEGFEPKVAAGLDVAYAPDSDRLVAAAVCVVIAH